jgi:hypothetical protein
MSIKLLNNFLTIKQSTRTISVKKEILRILGPPQDHSILKVSNSLFKTLMMIPHILS